MKLEPWLHLTVKQSIFESFVTSSNIKTMKKLHLLFPLFAVLILTSCSDKSNLAGWDYNVRSDGGFSSDFNTYEVKSNYEEDGYGIATLYAEEESDDKILQKLELGNVKMKRKILYFANLTISAKQPDSALAAIDKIAAQYGGYVSSSSTNRVEIRVKSELLKVAVLQIEALGNVTYKRFEGQDITESFFDAEIRLANAEKARKRYLELLNKAEDVKAAVLVEKELERLNGTIDLLKGKLNKMNHLSEFSTITVNVNERKKPGILGYIGLGLYHSVKWLFVRN